MLNRKHGTIAYACRTTIRNFWKDRQDKFVTPDVTVDPDSYELKSDMKNGWPSKRK